MTIVDAPSRSALRRLMLAGGGTAGHVFPATAVLAELPSVERRWIGSVDGMERSIVERLGISFDGIESGAVLGRGPLQLAGSAMRNLRGFASARAAIRRFAPDVVLGTGGYVSVPAILAARSLGIPTAVYLPDVEPGLAVKVLSRVVDRVACTTEESRRFLPPGKVVPTGYPVRAELRAWASRPDAKLAARAALGLSADVPVLLVMGGSRGARNINQAVWAALKRLTGGATVLHVTGEQGIDEARRLAGDRYRPIAFAHEEMAQLMAASELIVCRSGASVLGELPAFGLPGVLIPGTFAGGHQRHNAEYLSHAGAGIVFPDADLASPDALPAAVLPLLGAPSRLEEMSRTARSLDRPDAAARIAQVLAELARRNTR